MTEILAGALLVAFVVSVLVYLWVRDVLHRRHLYWLRQRPTNELLVQDVVLGFDLEESPDDIPYAEPLVGYDLEEETVVSASPTKMSGQPRCEVSEPAARRQAVVLPDDVFEPDRYIVVLDCEQPGWMFRFIVAQTEKLKKIRVVDELENEEEDSVLAVA